MSNIIFPWWNTTITIFNKYEDTQTRIITWYKTVVENCFWKVSGNIVYLNDSKLDTDTLTVRIPKDDRFLEKYLWIDISSTEKAQHFTLSTGDIIVKGTVQDEINEYTSGHRSSDFLQKYKDLQGCMIVNTFSDNSGIGRGQPHYLVYGK
jgi:hypothetical protein